MHTPSNLSTVTSVVFNGSPALSLTVSRAAWPAARRPPGVGNLLRHFDHIYQEGRNVVTEVVPTIPSREATGFEHRTETPVGQQAQVDFAGFNGVPRPTEEHVDGVVILDGTRILSISVRAVCPPQNRPTVVTAPRAVEMALLYASLRIQCRRRMPYGARQSFELSHQPAKYVVPIRVSFVPG